MVPGGRVNLTLFKGACLFIHSLNKVLRAFTMSSGDSNPYITEYSRLAESYRNSSVTNFLSSHSHLYLG